MNPVMKPVIFTRLIFLGTLSLMAWASAPASASAASASAASAAPAPAFPITVASPDGRLAATLDASRDSLLFSLKRGALTIVEPAPIGLTVDGARLGQQSEILGAERSSIHESYPVAGGHATGHNDCNALTLRLIPRAGGAEFQLDLRVFNDGAAYRFCVPGGGLRTVNAEASSWTVPAGSTIWYFERPNAWKLKSYAGYYTKAPIEGFEKVAKEPVHGPPLVLELPHGQGYAALTEAALYNYSGLRLRALGGRRLEANFTEGRSGFQVSGPVVTPWRVTLFSPGLDGLVNSDVITSLNPPPDPALFPDTAWIKPGRCVWSWLAEPQQPQKSPEIFELQKQYVDYAAGLGFEYSLVDEGWPKWRDPWGQLAELCAYGRAKGVGVLIWVNSKELTDPADGYRQLRDYLDRAAKAGAAGLKIDFINSESKAAVDFETAALTEAARRRLAIVFHGCQKPTGEARRFPNELSREGIRGLELNFMKEGPVTADHNAALPFTRFVAGHGDYTPVLFAPDRLGGTTWAHQVATAIAFTSPLLVYAEGPKGIEASPAADVLKAIPSTWDETRVLPGSRIGELALLARRKGGAWFVAALNGGGPREEKIALSFLKAGRYRATILTDNPARPDALIKRQQVVASGEAVAFSMSKGGGCVLRLEPAD